jgi:phosphohistidine phosphatase SixA
MKILISVFFLLATGISHANQALLEKLKEGGYNIFFRHAITGSTYNPPGEKIHDCSTQRPLNDQGRMQSKEIGRIFAENQIPIGKVYSSPICRCKETAEIAFGNFVTVDWLLAQRGRNQSVLDRYLKIPPEKGTNNIFIGHAITFSEGLLGNSWQKINLAEGEAIVIKPEFPIIVGRIRF